jgi:trehalose 6-phosphate synthase/phosphatase
MTTESIKGKRILMVSNRLPVNVQRGPDGLAYTASVGGLATGLSSLHGDHETLWPGWLGVVAKEDRAAVKSTLAEEFRCHPVFMSETLSGKYYEGFCNRSILPLFHSFTSYAKYSASEVEILQDPLRGEEMGKRGKEYVRQKFLIIRHLLDDLRLLNDVLH